MDIYADDVMVWTNNARKLEKDLKQLVNIRNKFGLKINLEKRPIQKIRRNLNVSCINLKGRQFKEVDTFSYLGSVVTRNVKIQNEINKRIKKVSQFYHLVKVFFKKQGYQQEM